MIDKYTTKEKGFHPFFLSDGWQVAQLNYSTEQNIENIKRIDVHFKTDEVFVLIRGEAVLITAIKGNDDLTFETELMEKGVVYNVPKNTWHNIAMEEGSEVLIVEKLNTHLGDYEYYYMNEQQMSELKNNVSNSFNRN